MKFSYIKHVLSHYWARFCPDSTSAMTYAMFMLMAVLVLLPDATLAQTGSQTVANTICNIVNELQGPVARGVAAFGIIFLGFSLFLGKISWGVALALAIGIGAIFGANEIVGLIGDGTDACN